MEAITPEIIQEVTLRIAAELNPSQIILFGSYAWGKPHKYSDLDLCVIVPDGIPGYSSIEWGIRAQDALEDLIVDVDILVTTQSIIDRFVKVPASLQRKIVEEGKVLYGQRQSSANTILAQKSTR